MSGATASTTADMSAGPGAGSIGTTPSGPRHLVVVLLDSLNRHLLGAYGSSEFQTPQLDRFASTAVCFDDHHAGSLPCMPARHDLLVGSLDFPWRPWGSIELWDEPVTRSLRRAGVVTHLVSDHPHLFETGGENYHCDFAAWEYLRGHESDAWRTRPDPSWVGAPSFGRGHTSYDNSRGWFRDEADFPGPRTMSAAAEWIARDAPWHSAKGDRWMLFVDEFDPHEPFDTPEPWASMYDPDWDGPPLIWPPYTDRAVAQGRITEREGRQIRSNYGAKLSMIDHWFGRLLDSIDGLAESADVGVVVCTDHGHYLGERDIWGKPSVPLYEPILHTPLMIRWPGVTPGRRAALTTNVDLHATICDAFGVPLPERAHGHSLRPLLDGSSSSVRDWSLAGIWGREVHLVDGTRKLIRGPVGDNVPLSMWSNRWSTMPLHAAPDLTLPAPDGRAVLDRMPGSSVPVIRQPFEQGDLTPFWSWAAEYRTECYRRVDDPGETVDVSGGPDDAEMVDLLRHALEVIAAPADQFVRLGLR